jgi:hypothetical protein
MEQSPLDACSDLASKWNFLPLMEPRFITLSKRASLKGLRESNL